MFQGSIRSRLIAVITSCVVMAVVVSIAAISWRDAHSFAQNRTDELTASAQVFASAVAPAVAEKDYARVRQTLTAFTRLREIMLVRVLSPENRVVAELGTGLILRRNEGSQAAPTAWQLIRGSALSVAVPVRYAGRNVGKLQILATTSSLGQRLLSNLAVTALIGLLALLVTIGLALRLQKSISQPITGLTAAMQQIETTNDFSVRHSSDRQDEIGQLTTSFNGLLEKITRRDREIQSYQRGLEDKVKERTAQLEVATQAAIRANNAKSEFLATMSHEILTPMNGVLVMAELLAASDLDPRQNRFANVIHRSGRSLLAIINDILDFSKIEAGQLTLEQTRFSPHDVLDDVLQLFWDKAMEKGVGLSGAINSSVPSALIGDPVRLTQVLSNLVNNALKFTSEGSVRVAISCRTEADACTLHVCVADTGIGIPKDKQSKIFESFAQADQSTTREYGGTGLGLTICSRLVAAMNGRLRVFSKPGQGSAFTFSAKLKVPVNTGQPHPPLFRTVMPAIAADDPATAWVMARLSRESRSDAPTELFVCSANHASQLDARNGATRLLITDIGDANAENLVARGRAEASLLRPVTTSAIRRLFDETGQLLDQKLTAATSAEITSLSQDARVLVVDDSAVNREVVMEALSRLGIRLDTVADGYEALDRFDPDRYDLVFMDCSMPGMSGFETTEKIREREQQNGWTRTPIIAMTAHVAGSVVDQWKRSGMDGYLAKPYTMAALSKCLEEWLPARPQLAEKTADAPAADASTAPQTDTDTDNNNDIIDPTVLQELELIQGRSLVTRVIGLFAQHAPKALANLHAEIANDDVKKMGEAAHALKSLSLNAGAARVAAIAAHIESTCAADPNADVRAPAHELNAELDRAITALHAWLVRTDPEVPAPKAAISA